MAAIEAFFEVTLARIGNPAVPDGCLVAQSASQVPVRLAVGTVDQQVRCSGSVS